MITYIVAWNLIVFFVYGIDKLKARNGGYRISEKVLLLCAFLLGGCGAMAGMYMFRHKTRKCKFKILVPLAVICNAISIYYLKMGI